MKVIRLGMADGERVEVPEGTWIRPVRRGFIFKCCDCGLKHRMDFSTRKRRALFRVFRVGNKRHRPKR